MNCFVFGLFVFVLLTVKYYLDHFDDINHNSSCTAKAETFLSCLQESHHLRPCTRTPHPMNFNLAVWCISGGSIFIGSILFVSYFLWLNNRRKRVIVPAKPVQPGGSPFKLTPPKRNTDVKNHSNSLVVDVGNLSSIEASGKGSQSIDLNTPKVLKSQKSPPSTVSSMYGLSDSEADYLLAPPSPKPSPAIKIGQILPGGAMPSQTPPRPTTNESQLIESSQSRLTELAK